MQLPGSTRQSLQIVADRKSLHVCCSPKATQSQNLSRPKDGGARLSLGANLGQARFSESLGAFLGNLNRGTRERLLVDFARQQVGRKRNAPTGRHLLPRPLQWPSALHPLAPYSGDHNSHQGRGKTAKDFVCCTPQRAPVIARSPPARTWARIFSAKSIAADDRRAKRGCYELLTFG